MKVLLFVISVMLCGVTDAHLNTPVCMQISNLFQSLCSVNATPISGTQIRSRPGKRGAPGIKGEIGPPGVASERGRDGIVNYEKVKKIVQEELLPEKQKTDQVVLQIDELTRRMEMLERWTDICKIKLENKCFWTENETRMTYGKALNLCRKHGGHPTNIYSKTHFDIMMLHLRTQFGNVYCWIGMTFNPETRTLSLVNGTPGPQETSLNWHRGYPHINTAYTRMGIVSKSDAASTSQGVHNWPSDNVRDCVVCEM